MSIRRYIVEALKKVHPRLGLKSSDVILASFPKSGNTWFRFIWANIGSLRELAGREIDFETLNSELDAVYDSYSYGELEFDCLPRLVKTHAPYSARAFGKYRSVYLYRHPGDVMVSYHRYLAAERTAEVEEGMFSEFIRDDRYGLPAWCRHVESWRREAEIVISYRALKRDAVAVTKRVLTELDAAAVEDSVVEEAVSRSSFDALRTLEEERGRPRSDEFSEGYRFVRKGAIGEWREHFSSQDVEYMQSKLSEMGLHKWLA